MFGLSDSSPRGATQAIKFFNGWPRIVGQVLAVGGDIAGSLSSPWLQTTAKVCKILGFLFQHQRMYFKDAINPGASMSCTATVKVKLGFKDARLASAEAPDIVPTHADVDRFPPQSWGKEAKSSNGLIFMALKASMNMATHHT